HPRLAEDVLAGLERGDRQGLVHVGPGADADRVHLRVVEHLAPVGRHFRNAELLRDLAARFRRAVGDRDELDALLLQESRNVPLPRVLAGADEADADLPLAHLPSLPCLTIVRMLIGIARAGHTAMAGARPTAS